MVDPFVRTTSIASADLDTKFDEQQVAIDGKAAAATVADLSAEMESLKGRVAILELGKGSYLPTIGDLVLDDYTPAVGATVEITAPSVTGGDPDTVANERYQVIINGVVQQTILKSGASDTFTVLAAWANQTGTVKYMAEQTGTGLAVEKTSPSFTVDNNTGTADVSFIALTKGTDIDGGATASTASISPTADRLILAAVVQNNSLSATPATPTATGNSLTWVQVNTVEWDTGDPSRKRLTVFRAMGAAPSTGAITFDFSSQNQTIVNWLVCEAGNVDTGGTNGSLAVVQSATATGEDLQIQTVTLSALGDAGNSVFGVFTVNGEGGLEVAGAGYTLLDSGGGSWTDLSMTSEYATPGTTTPDLDYGYVTGLTGAIALEIKPAATGGTSLSITGGGPFSWTVGQSVNATLATVAGKTTGAFSSSFDFTSVGLTFSTSTAAVTGVPTTSLASTAVTITWTDNSLGVASTNVQVSIVAQSSITKMWELHGETAYNQQAGLTGATLQCGDYFPPISWLADSHVPTTWTPTAVDGSTARLSRVQIGGKWYSRQAVHQGDPEYPAGTGRRRTDISLGSRSYMYPGETYWLAMRFRMPAAMFRPYGTSTGNWWVLWDCHQRSSSNSNTTGFWATGRTPWNPMTGNSDTDFQIDIDAVSDTSYNSNLHYNLTPYIAADTDTTLIVQEKIAPPGYPTGFVRAWIATTGAFTQVVNYTGQTKNSLDDWWYWKVACYSSQNIPAAVAPNAGELAYWYYIRHMFVVMDPNGQYTKEQIQQALKT